MNGPARGGEGRAKARGRRRAGAVVLVATVVGCASEQESVDERPERVVQEFIARLQRVHGDPKASRAAYELLWAEGRQNLAERAKRASAVTGQKVAPEEMIAPSRVWLRDQPRRFSSRVSGDWAEVVIEADSSSEHTEHVVRCAAEDGSWRVVLELPQLAPIERRITAPR